MRRRECLGWIASVLVVAAARTRVRAAEPCPACADKRTIACPTCKREGTVKARCPGCNGTRKTICPMLWVEGDLRSLDAEWEGFHEGTQRKCYNHRCEDGRVRGQDAKSPPPCKACEGRGKAPCALCREAGKACALCAGEKPAATGSCPDCGGAGAYPCALCVGPESRCTICEGNPVRCRGGCGGSGRSTGSCDLCRGVGLSLCFLCGGTPRRPCTSCDGTGQAAKSACTYCKGLGIDACGSCKRGLVTCEACDGSLRYESACVACEGKGTETCRCCGPYAYRAAEVTAAALVLAGLRDAAIPVCETARTLIRSATPPMSRAAEEACKEPEGMPWILELAPKPQESKEQRRDRRRARRASQLRRRRLRLAEWGMKDAEERLRKRLGALRGTPQK